MTMYYFKKGPANPAIMYESSMQHACERSWQSPVQTLGGGNAQFC